MPKENVKIEINPSVSLLVQDMSPPDAPDDLKILTLVSNAEQDFLQEPWDGSKIYILEEDSAKEYQILNIFPKTLKDLQHIAATYRELIKAHNVTMGGCVINFSVTPNLSGNLGVIFGYNVLISVIQNECHFEVRYNTYEPDDTGAVFTEVESAWKSKIEQKLGESFESFFNRLFFIET